MNKLTEFQKRALDYKSHLALTANAGSGKTFVLSKRFVRIFLETEATIDSIIAITFTDKAASELFVKIAKEVDELLFSVEDDQIRKKLINLRSNLINAKISTIHSFCSELLREFASDSGIDSSYSVFDQQQRNLIVESIVNDFISQKLTNNDENIKSLVRLFGSIAVTADNFKKIIDSKNLIQKLYTNLFCKNDDEIRSYYLTKENEMFEQYFQKDIIQLKNKLELINGLVSDKGEAGKAKKIVDEILQKIDLRIYKEDFTKIITYLKDIILTKKNEIRKRGYLSASECEKYSADISFIEKYFNEYLLVFDPDSLNNDELIQFIKKCYPVFIELIELYEYRKQKMNYLDFDDLLIKVESLIENEKVLSSLKDKYKYIMIDEFQDTNEIQYNIFMPILDKLNKGNLFIVGDEKQSIYMFRDAELEIFQKTKDEISTFASENIIQLPHSFRHSSKIAFFTNYIFSNLFKNQNLFFNEAENNSLVCTRNDFEKGSIEILFSNSDSQSEADLIADKITCLVDNENIKFGDIAILARKKSPFENVEKALLKKQIPFLTVGGKGFYQQQIILDINNYLMFLINPQNDLALIGILRSPFFYFSDSDIFLISKADGESFFEKLIESKSNKKIYSDAADFLQENIYRSEQVSISALINKIMTESGYFAVLYSRKDYKQDFANYQKILSISNHFSNAGYKSLFDFTQYIKDASVNIDDEGQAAIPSEVDAVKIMTIHKSKGLQFKVVFLIDTNNKMQSDSIKAKNIIFDKEYGILLSLPEENYFNKYSRFKISNIFQFRKAKKELAEAKRLFYVGITRAADYLFISADMSKDKIITDSFWNFLADSLQSDFKDSVIKIDGKLPVDRLDERGIHEIDFELSIPVNDCASVEKKLNMDDNEVKIPSINLNKNITQLQSGEIISASKINIFNQCPQKYNLIYNVGLDEVMKKLKSYKFLNKSKNKIEANVIGSAVHFILQHNLGDESLKIVIEKAATKYIPQGGDSEKINFNTDVKELIQNYLSSNVYRKISAHQNYKNEFQIYACAGDYYLFGIIDKIIITAERLIIIDYKTDSINDINREFKIDNYLYQLKFYAYLALKYFGERKIIELNLVFIKAPEKSFSQEYSFAELIIFGGEIKKIVSNIREHKFEYNFNHCKKCQFLYNDNCVAIDKSEQKIKTNLLRNR